MLIRNNRAIAPPHTINFSFNPTARSQVEVSRFLLIFFPRDLHMQPSPCIHSGISNAKLLDIFEIKRRSQ
jgi:hypothetical protein